jgi:hypothetical protein
VNLEGAEHSRYSSQREALFELLFVGEVMKNLWQKGVYKLEVLKPQVDASGYDVVFELSSVVRHVQLKSTKRGSRLRSVKVNAALGDKPGGCIILAEFNPDTFQLGPFYWWGASACEGLPDILGFPLAKHTKGNATGKKLKRQNIRQIPRSKLEKLDTFEEVVKRLFGRALSPED